MKKKLLFLLVAVLCFGWTACEYATIQPEPKGSVVLPDPEVPLSFATDVYPLFVGQSCTGCHGSLGGVNLETTTKAYTSLSTKNIITPNEAVESELITWLKTDHKSQHTFTTSQLYTIELWIDQGALNN